MPRMKRRIRGPRIPTPQEQLRSLQYTLDILKINLDYARFMRASLARQLDNAVASIKQHEKRAKQLQAEIRKVKSKLSPDGE